MNTEIIEAIKCESSYKIMLVVNFASENNAIFKPADASFNETTIKLAWYKAWQNQIALKTKVSIWISFVVYLLMSNFLKPFFF